MSSFKTLDIIFLFILIGCVVFSFWMSFRLYKKNKTNLSAHTNSQKIYPPKIRFVFSWMIYFWCVFMLFIPLFWLMEGKNPTYTYLWLFPLMFLFISIPAYPYYILSIDDEKISGATLWSWMWRREEIKLSEINREKVLHRNIGKFLGITILYSKRGEKILTLGLDELQISKILESAKNNSERDEKIKP